MTEGNFNRGPSQRSSCSPSSLKFTGLETQALQPACKKRCCSARQGVRRRRDHRNLTQFRLLPHPLRQRKPILIAKLDIE